MVENQWEDRIASTTDLYHSQPPVSAHRHPTPLSHADQPGRSSFARVSHLVLKTVQMARSAQAWNPTIAKAAQAAS